MDNRVRLTLMGLSYTPLQDGAFALLLAVEDSNKRIPIIIGAAEAQAIAIVLEGINPRRPMTHDLFATLAHGFGIELREVFIYGFEDGIFMAEMTYTDGERTITVDSRTSDAVAIAIRTGAPIFTTHDIVQETAIEFIEEDDDSDVESVENEDEGILETDSTIETMDSYITMSREDLLEALDRAIADDDFEEASIIQRIIDSRFPNTDATTPPTP